MRANYTCRFHNKVSNTLGTLDVKTSQWTRRVVLKRTNSLLAFSSAVRASVSLT